MPEDDHAAKWFLERYTRLDYDDLDDTARTIASAAGHALLSTIDTVRPRFFEDEPPVFTSVVKILVKLSGQSWVPAVYDNRNGHIAIDLPHVPDEGVDVEQWMPMPVTLRKEKS